MNAIIFIRHGQSKANVTNTLSSDIDGYPLTDEGVKQVEALAKTIPEGVKIDSFYTSPILRTMQTAKILEKKLGMEPVVEDRLREWNMGGLNNITFPSQADLDAAIVNEVDFGYKNGMEKWDSLQARMRSFAQSTNGITVAVTHQGPLVALLGTVDTRYAHFSPSIKIGTATATTIDFGRMKILEIGSAKFPTVSRG